MASFIKFGFVGVIAFIAGYLLGSFRSTSHVVSSDPNSGRFIGKPVTEWTGDGRQMKLLNDFVFIDSRDRAWTAEKGGIIDGASIPRPFWSVMGGPFEGKYRNASIVHDAECVRKSSPANDVHRMFYDACLAGGVPKRKANYLYWAVANYGPQWTFQSTSTVFAESPYDLPDATVMPERLETRTGQPRNLGVEPPSASDLEWAEKYFETHDPDIDLVPRLRPKSGTPPTPESNSPV